MKHGHPKDALARVDVNPDQPNCLPRAATKKARNRIEPWLRRHPLFAYFTLAFGISWGGILTLFTATGFDLATPQPLDTGLMFLCMLLGPSTSGLALTAALDGRAGLRRLLADLMYCRVDVRWYAFALLATPILLLAVLWPLGAFVDPAFAPRFQWALFAVGLVAGSFEELGWTGFATPRLLDGKRLPMAGLSLGVVWGLWHMLVAFRSNFATMGVAWLLEFAIFYIAALTAYRVLMTWVYMNTRSLLVAVLMHASYTGWLFVLYPATSFDQGLLWQAAFAACLWMLAALTMVVPKLAQSRNASGLVAVPHPRFASPTEGDPYVQSRKKH